MPITTPPGLLGVATPHGELINGGMTAELDAYKAAGTAFVRTDFWWDQVEATKNSFNWSGLDTMVNEAHSRGLSIVAELGGMPSWVQSSGGMGNSANVTEYADFAKAVEQRYGDKVNVYEIWNEPNGGGFWANPNVEHYTNALKAASTALKSATPGTTVLTGGLTPAPETVSGSHISAAEFIEGIYAHGGKDYFDAVAFHPYSYPLMPNDPAAWHGWHIMEDDIRGTMVANGDSGKQVWITEYGAPTSGTNSVSESTQASMLQQAVDLAKGTTWAGPIFYYSYQDRGGSTGNAENWFGMKRPDGTNKPAWTTYSTNATADGGGGTDTPTFTTQNYYGTNSAETIIGNAMANTINGAGGNDTIKGGGGADIIIGGPGNDTLYGGAGNDLFDFNIPTADGTDTIMDVTTGDKIDLRGIDANSTVTGNQAFTFIGTNWLNNAGDLGYYQDAGAGITSVQGDLNGDDLYDFTIVVQGLKTFTSSDFLL